MNNYVPVDSNNKVVATAGAAVTLVPASTPGNRVDIQALYGNTGVIAVGGPSVSASNPKGIILKAGDVYSIEKITDLLGIWIDSSVNGEGVSYTWWLGENV